MSKPFDSGSESKPFDSGSDAHLALLAALGMRYDRYYYRGSRQQFHTCELKPEQPKKPKTRNKSFRKDKADA